MEATGGHLGASKLFSLFNVRRMASSRTDEEDLISPEASPRFRRVPTLVAAITQIMLCVAQIVLVFLLPSLYDKHQVDEDRKFGSFSLLIYSHGAHWAAFLIIDQFLHHHHHKSRLQVSSYCLIVFISQLLF